MPLSPPPEFIPIPSCDIIDVPPMEKDESREVPLLLTSQALAKFMTQLRLMRQQNQEWTST